MKTKLKMLAAAIAVAASTGSAQAAIATFASGNGEMFLNVRDNVNGLSYVRDLGIFLDNFQPGSESFTPVAPDATLTSFLSGKPSNTLEWSVLAGDAIGGNVGEVRYITTSLADKTQVDTTTNGGLFQFQQVDNNVTAMNGDFWAQTQADVAQNLSYAGSGSGPGTLSSGLESYWSPSLDDFFGNAPFYNTAQVGQSQNFYHRLAIRSPPMSPSSTVSSRWQPTAR
jgi:hypothetical protein